MTAQLTTFIFNHWLLFLALVVVLLLLFLNEKAESKKRPNQLSPQAAVQLMNDEAAVVIDLRDAEKFEKGHIIHALRATAEEFNQKRFEKYKTTPIILSCTDGTNAAKLANQLQTNGFLKTYVLAGGINAWRDAELPLVKGR